MNFQSSGFPGEDLSSTGSSMFSSGAPKSASYSRTNQKRSDSKNHTTHVERNHFLESTDELSFFEEANRLKLTQRQVADKIKAFSHARYGKKNERMTTKYNDIGNKM
jgi:hypothetical protein